MGESYAGRFGSLYKVCSCEETKLADKDLEVREVL
jgi:hypothetical protein